MVRRILAAGSLLGCAVALTACEASKSSNPLSPSVAGPIPGINITAPSTVDPQNGVKIAMDKQPVTLSVSNAGSNGPRPLNYLFEVATDANFNTKVFTRDGIAPGDQRKDHVDASRSACNRADIFLADPSAGRRQYRSVLGGRQLQCVHADRHQCACVGFSGGRRDCGQHPSVVRRNGRRAHGSCRRDQLSD